MRSENYGRSLSTALILFFFATNLSAQEPELIEWQTDAVKAWKTSKSSERPILLFVTSHICHQCQKMAQETYGEENVVADVSDRFVPVKVDSEELQTWKSKPPIKLYPTTLIINPKNRREVVRIEGYVTAEEFRLRLAEAFKQESIQR